VRNVAKKCAETCAYAHFMTKALLRGRLRHRAGGAQAARDRACLEIIS
jgi:hypothetical protein